MNFHEFPTGWESLRKSGLAAALGFRRMEDVIERFLHDSAMNDPISYRHGLFMQGWYATGRPYYNVWPCIVPPMSNISLDFPGTAVVKPSGLSHLVLRFPADGSAGLQEDAIEVRTMFISFQPVNRAKGLNHMEDGVVIGMDIGESDLIAPGCEVPVHTLKIFPLDERTVADCMYSLPEHPSTYLGTPFPRKLMHRCLNLAIAVCMMQTDPDILEPDCLNVDLSKITKENINHYQQKAIRRGKYGFHLGRHMEVIPHFRRPHPALMWTGHGRTIPRIVFRKGSLVHREVIEKMPTGREQQL